MMHKDCHLPTVQAFALPDRNRTSGQALVGSDTQSNCALLADFFNDMLDDDDMMDTVETRLGKDERPSELD